MNYIIPGHRTIEADHLVLDYNGTIAVDGAISEPVQERLKELSRDFQIHILTADTHGTAAAACQGLPVQLHTFPTGNAAEEKADIVWDLGPKRCICMGNGRNDIEMFRIATLRIGIMGPEGIAGMLMPECDLIVPGIEAGLDLLLKPKRLIAGLRG